MQADPEQALNTIIKYLLFLNMGCFIITIFDVYRTLTVIVIGLNVLLLLLYFGIKKDKDKIRSYNG